MLNISFGSPRLSFLGNILPTTVQYCISVPETAAEEGLTSFVGSLCDRPGDRGPKRQENKKSLLPDFIKETVRVISFEILSNLYFGKNYQFRVTARISGKGTLFYLPTELPHLD